MEKKAKQKHDNQMEHCDTSKINKSSNKETKKFKQELLKSLIQELKRTTKIIETFNTSFFMNDCKKDSKPSKRFKC